MLFFLPVMAYIWSRGTWTNSHELSPVVQTHLKRVYLCLTFSLVVSAIGAYVNMLCNLAGIFTYVASIAGAIWFFFTPPDRKPKRICSLMVAFLFGGASISPAIELAIDIDPNAPIAALAGSVWVFTCIYIAAVVSFGHEGHLCLSGFFAKGISGLLYLWFASKILSGSSVTVEFELNSGLLVLYQFGIRDAQYIIDRANHGDLDYVKHSLIFFNAFACLFFWILKSVFGGFFK